MYKMMEQKTDTQRINSLIENACLTHCTICDKLSSHDT